MPLSNQFTDGEVEYVREIVRLSNAPDSVAILVARLDTLNAAQVIATQRDIDQWTRIEYGTEKSKGGIKGTDYDTERNRQYIRNKVRERLGYPPLPSGIGAADFGILTIGISSFGSGGVPSDEFTQ